MTSHGELDELYKEVILDHYHHPRHNHDLPGADMSSVGYNPTCGDEIIVQLKITNGIIEDIGVRGKGCSISQASGSMLAESLVGKTLEQARGYIASLRALLEGEGDLPPESRAMLGDLEALEGVKIFPVRIKCAILAWTTLEDGIRRFDEKHHGV